MVLLTILCETAGKTVFGETGVHTNVEWRKKKKDRISEKKKLDPQ